MEDRIKTFEEFYPFYLKQHSNKICRLLHVIGTTIVLSLAFTALYHNMPKLWIAVPIAGYAFFLGGSFLF